MTTEITSPASIFGEEDERIERALDIERFSRMSVYNHAGFRPVRNGLLISNGDVSSLIASP